MENEDGEAEVPASNIEMQADDDLTEEEEEGVDVDLDSMKTTILDLRKRQGEILRDKKEMEIDFGLKRAKFMELFRQKEDEVASEKRVAGCLQEERDELMLRVTELQHELDECKSRVAVLEFTRDGEIGEERRRCREEIASLQQIAKETIAEATQRNREYEREIGKLKRIIEKLENESHEGKSQPASDSKEGVLSAMTKTIAKKVSGLNSAYSQSNENINENLEDSMKKPASSSSWWAQEDAEVLRSLVVPLEEEIVALKEKLRAADDQIRAYEGQSAASKNVELALTESMDRKLLLETDAELDEKLKGLHVGLQAEKSSRSDLEMYVAVLQSQKATLTNEAEDLRKQLREVCEILDKEKREHTELKQTWHMANDQFLEAQKVQTDDMKRMRSLLTTDQQRVIQELQKKDSVIPKDASGVLQPLDDVSSQSSSKRSSPISFPSSPHRRKSPSPAKQGGAALDRSGGGSGGGGANEEFTFEAARDFAAAGKAFHESMSSSESMEEPGKVGDALAERDAAAVAAAAAADGSHCSRSDGAGSVRRLYSEKEWLAILEELKGFREKSVQPCDMCSNYETQLQKAQDRERTLAKSIKALEQSNKWHKADLLAEQNARKDLEAKLAQSATEMHRDVAELYNKMGEMEKVHFEFRQQFKSHAHEVTDTLKGLSTRREDVENELKRLQRDNDKLIGKYSESSRQMQNETIELPNNIEDAQLMLLQIKEELIIAKMAKEHLEETLRSEILFMKERAKDEQHNRESTEGMLTQEIDSLREKVGILESLKMQHESEQQLRIELEKSLKETQQKHADSQSKQRQILNALQKRHEESLKCKDKLEAELSHLRCKVQTLQVDLDNSEAVQRDFVKLSQSLQVQLEKIRESKNQVRWQHEEDVSDCSNCRQPFSVSRRRTHCRHCGKIFCGDCTAKVVPSGPNSRPSKVCDVCHTLLVQDTAPYFSTEPPHTPD